MLHCTVRYCGGCNPMYERGKAYRSIVSALSDVAAFSYPQEGEHYDVLLIIRGCTGCPYLYEDISADHRIICVSQGDVDGAVEQIRQLA